MCVSVSLLGCKQLTKNVCCSTQCYEEDVNCITVVMVIETTVMHPVEWKNSKHTSCGD